LTRYLPSEPVVIGSGKGSGTGDITPNA